MRFVAGLVVGVMVSVGGVGLYAQNERMMHPHPVKGSRVVTVQACSFCSTSAKM